MQDRDDTYRLLILDKLVDDAVAADPQRAQSPKPAAKLVPADWLALEQTERILDGVDQRPIELQQRGPGRTREDNARHQVVSVSADARRVRRGGRRARRRRRGVGPRAPPRWPSARRSPRGSRRSPPAPGTRRSAPAPPPACRYASRGCGPVDPQRRRAARSVDCGTLERERAGPYTKCTRMSTQVTRTFCAISGSDAFSSKSNVR